MIPCAFCERPLTCAACQTPYLPESAEAYAALSRIEQPVACPACEHLLVCHWCRTPYDGLPSPEDGEEES